MTEKMTYGILPLYKSFVVKIEVDDEVVKSLNKLPYASPAPPIIIMIVVP